MKRVTAMVLGILLALLFSLPVYGAASPAKEPRSEFVYLYNLDTDKEIYAKNAEKPAYPASLVKIMTCILALENISDLNEVVVYPDYVQDYLYNYQRNHGSVSLAGMYAGEQMSVIDLLHGLMLRSGNETAMILAHHIAGGQAEFVEMMNRRAKELGATKTTFVNPNGLFDPQQTTTAKDMATLTRYALTLPGFKDIVSTPSYSAGPTNKNNSLDWSTTILMQIPSSSYYYPYLSGVKTGTLPEAGRCFVSTATRDGFTYLLVTMGGPYLDEQGKPLDSRSDFDDHRDIYDWAFDTFKVKSLVEKNKPVTEIPLRLNMEKDHITLVTAERFTSLVEKDVDPVTSVSMKFDIPEYLEAPVQKGQSVGWVTLVLGGEEVGKVELLASESVAPSRALLVLEKVKSIFASFWFKFIVIFLALFIILYIVLMILRNRNRRRRKKRTLYKPRRRI